jgi:hypothetical protein
MKFVAFHTTSLFEAESISLNFLESSFYMAVGISTQVEERIAA